MRRISKKRPAPEANAGRDRPKDAQPDAPLHPLIKLQETAGNRAVQGLLRSHAIQAKLKISQPEDAHEREADQIAEQSVSSAIPAQASASSAPEDINRAATQAGEVSAPNDSAQRTGAGQSLDHSTRSSMEGHLGVDLSPVRIHTGGEAAKAARDVKARAFTVGHDVVFGEGEYSPGTSEGQRLLAHELTHVAQQTGAAGRPVTDRPQELSRDAAPEAAPASLMGAKPDAVKAPQPPVFQEVLDYDRIAAQIHEGISGGWFFGLGTDEEGVYRALQELDRDPQAIKLLKAKYLEKYGESLESAIHGDFSGTELEYALQLLNMGDPKSAQAIEAVPSTDEEWIAAAKRIGKAVNRAGTDEEAIYAVLLPLNRDPELIKRLEAAYAREYGEDLRARIDSEMSSSEKDYALHLMGEGGASPGGAFAILTYIKEEAEKKAQTPPAIDPASKFSTVLKEKYLKDYLANPTAEEGKKATSEKIGRQMEGRTTTSGVEVKPEGGAWRPAANRWEEFAIRSWNKEKIPELPLLARFHPLFKNISNLPPEISAATDILMGENIANLPLINVPFLVGNVNPEIADFNADVTGGGKNISQLMHWGTGVKYSDLPRDAMRDLFVAYEKWHLEAWDVFGQDPINDLIAEEQGRILGAELRKGGAGAIKDEATLQGFLNQSFLESRAWVGSLLRMRRNELEWWILAKEQKKAQFHWDPGDAWKIWPDKTVTQMLASGMSEKDVKDSYLVRSQIEIYTLIYEADKWEKEHGPIEITPLQKALVEGGFDSLIADMTLKQEGKK